jgi:hypothetical protein
MGWHLDHRHTMQQDDTVFVRGTQAWQMRVDDHVVSSSHDVPANVRVYACIPGDRGSLGYSRAPRDVHLHQLCHRLLVPLAHSGGTTTPFQCVPAAMHTQCAYPYLHGGGPWAPSNEILQPCTQCAHSDLHTHAGCLYDVLSPSKSASWMLLLVSVAQCKQNRRACMLNVISYTISKVFEAKQVVLT